MKKLYFLPFGLFLFAFTDLAVSGVTWDNDYLITGTLAVGTSATNRALTVSGSATVTSEASVGALTISSTTDRLATLSNNENSVKILITDEDLSTGHTAPVGSIGFGGSSFETKYGSEDGDWGPVIYQDRKGAVAMNWGYADGDYSLAANAGSWAVDTNSAALNGSTAIGEGSIAMSAGATWSSYSTAMSYGVAAGNNSIAGGQVTAVSFASIVFGRNNAVTGTESSDEWVGSDPLFQIGNGTGNSGDAPGVQNHNALTVYKNGKIMMDRQGDIPMGQYGNPE